MLLVFPCFSKLVSNLVRITNSDFYINLCVRRIYYLGVREVERGQQASEGQDCKIHPKIWSAQELGLLSAIFFHWDLHFFFRLDLINYCYFLKFHISLPTFFSFFVSCHLFFFTVFSHFLRLANLGFIIQFRIHQIFVHTMAHKKWKNIHCN